MKSRTIRKDINLRRKTRVAYKVGLNSDRPRLYVFRSNKYIYAQIIDDVEGRTLVSASSLEPSIRELAASETKTEQAKRIGKIISERAVASGIDKVVFDRNGFLYHGRVKAVSDGAREGGLNF